MKTLATIGILLAVAAAFYNWEAETLQGGYWKHTDTHRGYWEWVPPVDYPPTRPHSGAFFIGAQPMKTQTLDIKLTNGTQTPVRATLHGPFAVHRHLNKSRWQVTHRPTCHSTLNTRGTDTRKHAETFAKWLRSLPINWKQDDVLLLQNEANAYFTDHSIRLIDVITSIEATPCSNAKP